MARLGKFFYINGTDNLSNAHFLRVRADGGITESLGCIDTAGTLLESASYFMRPSGYKEDTVYSLIPNNSNGSLNFTRASDAWRTNIDGLIQRVPWNLADNSNTFPNLSGITKTTGQVSPIDSTSGNLLTATGSGEHYSGTTTLTAIAGTSYTYSVYAKFVQGVNIALRTVFSNGFEDVSTIWNLSTGATVLTNVNHTNPTITPVGSGWYRISITYTPSTIPAFPLVFRVQMAVGTSLTFTANAGDGFLAYGAQVNEGILNPYFPTTDRLNVPRLDYTYGTCPALLLEPQRTNTLLYSNDFTNAVWVKDNSGATNPVVTANYGTSPDGSNNASRLQLNKTGGTFSRIYQYASAGAGTYSFTVYMKSNTGSSQNVGLRLESVGINCVVTTSWQRFTLNSTVSTAQAQIMLYDLISGNDETADILFYGAQLELGAYPTTYIPTTTASATRIADSFSRNNIYTNGLITSSGGTWFVELRGNVAYTRDSVQSNSIMLDTATGGVSNGFAFIGNAGSGRLRLQKFVSGTGTVLYLTSANTVKIAIKWNGSTADIFENGVKVVSATSFTPTAMEFLNATTLDVPKFIQAMALFNYSLSDADCQLITT